jgi:hypothetical protein
VATRKTGSRPIVVDGTRYRWRIRRRATFLQSDYGFGNLHVAVQLDKEPATVLVLETDRRHPADIGSRPIVPVRPADIEDWVRQAINLGWCPNSPGPTFLAKVMGAAVSRAG